MVPAVTVKLADVAPEATVTEPGVVSRLLLSDSVTAVLPVAALLNVTVQVALAPEANVPGLHCREESTADVPVPVVPTAEFMSACISAADKARL